MDIGDGEAGSGFVVLGETTAATEPCECAFDDPALGQNLETDRMIRALDDFQLPGTERPHCGGCAFSLIAAVGENPLDEREQPPHGLEDEQTTVAILDAGRMNHNAQREAERVDQDMSLLSFDFLPRVIARRVDPRPPFSAPLTLWLSMIAAVGLASLPACSRVATKSA